MGIKSLIDCCICLVNVNVRQRHEDSTESSPVDGGAVENVPATGLGERGLLVSGLHGPEQGEATLLLRGPAEADTGNCQYLEPEETTQ